MENYFTLDSQYSFTHNGLSSVMYADRSLVSFFIFVMLRRFLRLFFCSVRIFFSPFPFRLFNFFVLSFFFSFPVYLCLFVSLV